MKNILILVTAICFINAGIKQPEGTVVYSGNNLIKLKSHKSQLSFNRKSELGSLKKIDNISTEKRRHKRRRKVRPPRHGK